MREKTVLAAKQVFWAAAAVLATAAAPAIAVADELPRLVLQITVDQLRGDLIGRYAAGFGDDGFRYLLDNGIVYTNAHHDHANTETIVGHVTLSTGAYPAIHGMIGNIWFDRDSGEVVYNVEDARYPVLTAGAGVDADSEIDPTQKAASTDGRSPLAIMVSTLSDEFAMQFGPQAKVFAVSVKDRGAISFAGHAGTAYWFSKASAEFITSSFYMDAYPDWVSDWNAQGRPASYADTSWQLMLDESFYEFADRDDQIWEVDFPGYGRTFPHAYGPADGKYFTTLLTLSPAGDELTLDFTKALITAEDLGADATPDYLSISFSSTDYVGHIFGPSSLEAEDNIKRLDRTLADLFTFIDKKVGLENTLIVLSADHGAPEAPGFMESQGFEAGYFDFDDIDRTPAIAALRAKYGIAEELIETYQHPYVYLDHDVLAERGLDQAEVARSVAEELQKMPGIALAVASSSLETGSYADTWLMRRILNNYNPDRSGDVFVVFEPNWFINDFDGLEVAVTHGSPWRYDSFVPLIFVRPGVAAQRISREVHTVDVAPTLATILGTKMPSGTSGKPLAEVADRD